MVMANIARSLISCTTDGRGQYRTQHTQNSAVARKLSLGKTLKVLQTQSMFSSDRNKN
jgi:hypothetical protein